MQSNWVGFPWFCYLGATLSDVSDSASRTASRANGHAVLTDRGTWEVPLRLGPCAPRRQVQYWFLRLSYLQGGGADAAPSGFPAWNPRLHHGLGGTVVRHHPRGSGYRAPQNVGAMIVGEN